MRRFPRTGSNKGIHEDRVPRTTSKTIVPIATPSRTVVPGGFRRTPYSAGRTTGDTRSGRGIFLEGYVTASRNGVTNSGPTSGGSDQPGVRPVSDQRAHLTVRAGGDLHRASSRGCPVAPGTTGHPPRAGRHPDILGNSPGARASVSSERCDPCGPSYDSRAHETSRPRDRGWAGSRPTR